jgi:threonine-phosphate decarboxylase
LGISARAARALSRVAALVGHYPDPECVSLKKAIQRRWHVALDRIVVGNGATELIDLIPRALGLRSALILGPTYEEYARAIELAGGRTSMVMARRDEDYRPPVEAIMCRLAAQRRGKMVFDAVFLCHPNNPTGQPCRLPDLRELMDAADRAGIWVVVDESFIEYCERLTCVPYLPRYSRLIVLRSFTKFYGLPGLRVGYSLSSQAVAAHLRRCQPPWTVNALAQRAAEAAITDLRHAQRSCAYVQKERGRLAAQLANIEGIRVIPSTANFLFIELPSSFRSSAITSALRRQGMLIRDCSRWEGCSERMIRVAVRPRRDNACLLAALEKLLKG